MKENQSDAHVKVSKMTLKAVTKLLLGNDGVNITPLVKDLMASPLAQQSSEDLVALNVSLVLKGIVPELSAEEKKPRKYYSDRIVQFQSYSLIGDCITYNFKDREEEKGIMTLSEWLSRPLAE